jgi:hypothetical protein
VELWEANPHKALMPHHEQQRVSMVSIIFMKWFFNQMIKWGRTGIGGSTEGVRPFLKFHPIGFFFRKLLTENI